MERDASLSRINVVTSGTDMVIEQIKAQLDRLVPVHQVADLPREGPHVAREMALVKVVGTGETRVEALRIADTFRARVVDTTTESFVFELTGSTDKLDAFIELMRDLGLAEVVAHRRCRPGPRQAHHRDDANVNDWLSSIGYWIEHHSAAAAWVQAIGATLAVATAVLVPALQARHARQQRDDDRQLRAKSLAVAIYPDLLHIRTIHRRIRSRLSQSTAHTTMRVLADAAIAGSDLLYEVSA